MSGMRPLLSTLRRRPLRTSFALLSIAAFVALEWVRGHAIEADERPLESILHEVAGGEATIGSQIDLDRVGRLAHALVRAEGKSPGPFYLQFLPALDHLEKIRHLVHAPFVGNYTNLYCDVWIHSLTTYGSRELTWTLTRTHVRPALELPILLFLLDRLGMERTVLQERFGAVFEATRGMSMHELSGRARLWDRVLRHAVKYPEMGDFLQAQLRSYDWDAVEGAEIQFWREMSLESTRARVETLMVGASATQETPHPIHGIMKVRELIATYAAGPREDVTP